jgi:hypothetical protein
VPPEERLRALPPPLSGGAVMTRDNRYVIKTNIARYRAMLTLDMDDKKRSVVERLLVEAEEVLAADFKTQQ